MPEADTPMMDTVETPYPDSRWVVMKFGGTSVATAANWARIAELVRATLAEGANAFICHSALAGVSNALIRLLGEAENQRDTDRLLGEIEAQHTALAAELGVAAGTCDEVFAELRQLVVGVRLVGEVSPRVHARVLSAGELAATRLGAAYLASVGLAVGWRNASELLQSIEDPDQSERAGFLAARCRFEPDPVLERQLEGSPEVIVTQGFIARNPAGDVVLLGRGGSDTSGAYFAGKLRARRLEIWTDVPGFFSADPRAMPSARLIRFLHYSEAQEIASAGGGILHPRSISPVRRSGIPLYLRCTPHPEWEGTIISNAAGEDKPQLKAVSHRKGITLISMESFEMWHQVGFLAEAFECFKRHGISVDLISTSESNVTVTVDMTANVTTREALEALAGELRNICRVSVVEDCAAVTLIGRRMRASLHQLMPVFEAFQEHRMHLVTQAANDLNLTVVLGGEHAHKLVADIHAQLVRRLTGGVFGPTWSELQAAEQPAKPLSKLTPWWVDRREALLELMQSRASAYVYDRASIVSAADSLMALANVDQVFYAMKANSNPDVLREIHGRGLNLECVSPGEVRAVMALFPGIDPGRILFTPNFASRAEYEWALAQGVRLTLDSLYPLQTWAEIFRDREIFVRIDTGKGRGHHEHVKTAGVQSKFGVPLFELDELKHCIATSGVRVVGLHAHTGSGVLNPDAWRQTGEQLAAIREHFTDLRFMDLGGGLGVPERPGEQPLDMPALDAGIGAVREACPGIELWLEPGRFLVAEAGVLLVRVTQKKGKGDMQYLGVSTGMNSLIRPALYGAYHEIVNLTRVEEPATQLTTVVGPICESADKLGTDRLLPHSEEGDVLLVANAGAYGRVMSSFYNMREPAEEVLV